MTPRQKEAHAQVFVIRTSTKADALYHEAHGLIIKGDFELGSTVAQEAPAADLGLSVAPLREALRGLKAEGQLRTSTHRTITVTPLALTDTEDSWPVCLQLARTGEDLAARHRAVYSAARNHVLSKTLTNCGRRRSAIGFTLSGPPRSTGGSFGQPGNGPGVKERDSAQAEKITEERRTGAAPDEGGCRWLTSRI